MDHDEPRPIFIVGSPRSGTTLLRLILDSHPNISCGPETGFLPNLEPILGRRWSHLELYGFSKEYWRQKIAAFFDSFKLDYAREMGKLRWADKTPRYTLHLDFILTVFPRCQIVHIIRDGRDVVASHRDRWGYRKALGGIQAWKKYVGAARKFGQRVADDQYYELRYEDLVTDAEMTLQGLFSFLGEPWDEGVLNYLQAPHDHQPTYAAYTQERRRDGGDQAQIYSSRIGVWRRELDPFLKGTFYLWAGALLKELGYR